MTVLHKSFRPLFAAALFALETHSIRAETIVVERPMPAPLVEAIPTAPRVGMAWVQGHWVWRRVAWDWVKGHYVEGFVPIMPAAIVEQQPPRPSPEHVWVRGHWGWEGARWTWRPGIWFRP
jgi:hypothetical protein